MTAISLCVLQEIQLTQFFFNLSNFSIKCFLEPILNLGDFLLAAFLDQQKVVDLNLRMRRILNQVLQGSGIFNACLGHAKDLEEKVVLLVDAVIVNHRALVTVAFYLFDGHLEQVGQILEILCHSYDKTRIFFNIFSISFNVIWPCKNDDSLNLLFDLVLLLHDVNDLWNSSTSHDNQNIILDSITREKFLKLLGIINCLETRVAEMLKAFLILFVFISLVNFVVNPIPSVKPTWIVWSAVFACF